MLKEEGLLSLLHGRFTELWMDKKRKKMSEIESSKTNNMVSFRLYIKEWKEFHHKNSVLISTHILMLKSSLTFDPIIKKHYF